MQDQPIVDVVGLGKRYGSTVAVDDLAFTLGPGRVLAMVGPNGAGKTTTLRALAGIVRPDAGQVRIAGIDVWADPVAAKRRLAWVPHEAQLFDALTIWEHLAFVASAWAVPAGWEARGRTLLERFELQGKATAACGSLSLGMRQKVSLVMAALHQPTLFMLDEPMTGLDPRAIRTCKDWIREEAARGAGLILSSHLLSVVDDLCTDLLVLVEGRVRFFGPLEEARRALQGEKLEDLFFRATEPARPP
ncbi:MAG: ABC transporter ATP-binding protein [Alphaproteobacteria bacterium]|nr:ABC transporter ATP-binding protein [Alphaproteobacteria bacterium]